MNIIKKYLPQSGRLYFPQEGSEYSSLEIEQKIKTYIESLRQHHITENSRVLLLLPNGERFCFYLMASWSMGATVIPISPQTSSHDLDYIIENTQPDIIIRIDSIDHLKNLTNNSQIQTGPLLILFTSGTSGKPKGIPIYTETIELKIIAYSKYIKASDLQRTLCFLPLSFGHGLISNFLFPLFKGNNIYLYDFSDIKFIFEFGTIISKHKITFFSTVPSMLDAIAKSCQKIESESLLRVHCASANLTNDLYDRSTALFGKNILYNIYGATELASWFAGCTTPLSSYHAGFVGKAWDCEVKISDDKNNEILVRAPYLFSNYLVPNSDTHLNDGWFKTGDFGKIDIDGNIFIEGHLDNVINLGGMKIYPQEIDLILKKFPIIKEAQSFTVNHHSLTKIVTAIILIDGAVLEEGSLKLFIQNNLPKIKRPFDWIVIPRLPTNKNGKISVDMLREIYFNKN